MTSKNLKKGPENVKHKPPPLIQDAEELYANSELVSAEAHGHAGLAHLFQLILDDPSHPYLVQNLRRGLQSHHCMREDPIELSKNLAHEAASLHMHPVLLAMAMIWWIKEADLAENETVGSADWQLAPICVQNQRKDLQEEFRALEREIETLFRGGGLEPEVAVELIRKKCKALDHGLLTLLKSIKGHRAKRKRLFYENSKTQIKAYYLLRVRRLKTTADEMLQLLAEAGEPIILSDKKDRLRTQKRLHQWADDFEALVDTLMLDFGFRRSKHEYVSIDPPIFF